MTVALNGAANKFLQRCIDTVGHSLLHGCCPHLGRRPIGNLNQYVGIIKHLITRAAQKTWLARSIFRRNPFKQTFELSPFAWFGL